MTIDTLSFRFATFNDIETIISIVNQSYLSIEPKRTNYAEVSNILNQNDAVILLAVKNEIIIACIALTKKPQHCHVSLFAVNADFQNQGIGSVLLEKAEEYIKTYFKQLKIKLEILYQRKNLLNFYLHRGYQRTGIFLIEEISYLKQSFQFEVLEKALN